MINVIDQTKNDGINDTTYIPFTLFACNIVTFYIF